MSAKADARYKARQRRRELELSKRAYEGLPRQTLLDLLVAFAMDLGRGPDTRERRDFIIARIQIIREVLAHEGA